MSTITSAVASITTRGNIEGGQVWNGIPSRQYNPFQVPDYAPSGFAIPYNLTYCPAGTTQFNVPPIIAYYPYHPRAVFGVVGDYFNISWINASLTYTFTGQDNVPYSALRQQTNDPFANAELLTHYYKGDNPPYGFYHQQIAKVLAADLVAPGLSEVDSRPQFILRPGCDHTAAQFGWYFAFCFAKDAKTAPPDFNLKKAANAFVTAVSAGATQALVNVWDILEEEHHHKRPFNSTKDCTECH